jgi:putative FmdB family regulatory protein
MPTYEYLCENCGFRFERFQRITDDPIAHCPRCQGSVHRVFFPVSVMFKGRGFYSTDYGRGTSAASGNGKSGDRAGTDAEGAGTAAESKSSDKPTT